MTQGQADPGPYDSSSKTAWCPGCGNFAILRAVKAALVETGKHPHEILIVSGIGQAAKLPQYMNCNMFNGLHGRTLPVATGAKLANPALTVLAVGGDGDGLAEGGNHFLHAARRNIGVTYLIHDNQVFGLTRGQASPTSDAGFVTKTTPFGVFPEPFNLLAVAIAMKANYVARGFAGDVEHLAGLIAGGIRHPGFAVIDILQPCVVFNRKNTFQWYRERVYKLEEEGHDPGDYLGAFERAQEWGERIPLGVFYRGGREPYEAVLPPLKAGRRRGAGLDPSVAKPLFDGFL